MGDRLQAGKPSRYVTSHPGQLSLAIPPWVGAMSTSESWDVNRHTARCASRVSVVWQCKLVSGWGLRKRRSAPLYGPCGLGRTLCIIVIKIVKTYYLTSFHTWLIKTWHCLYPFMSFAKYRLVFKILSLECSLANRCATFWNINLWELDYPSIFGKDMKKSTLRWHLF